MLGLQLRNEFQGVNMPGTTISLHRSNSQGATDKAPLLPDNVINYLIPARNILLREMEYEGVIPEGASYSVTPLAILLLT